MLFGVPILSGLSQILRFQFKWKVIWILEDHHHRIKQVYEKNALVLRVFSIIQCSIEDVNPNPDDMQKLLWKFSSRVLQMDNSLVLGQPVTPGVTIKPSGQEKKKPPPEPEKKEEPKETGGASPRFHSQPTFSLTGNRFMNEPQMTSDRLQIDFDRCLASRSS